MCCGQGMKTSGEGYVYVVVTEQIGTKVDTT